MMKITPLVSVLMPAFNSELYIAEAIESILNQTYKNIQLLIFDDGSTDNTRAVIEEYDDPRIVKILSDKNFGVVHARNEMIDAADGKYIALMDADDVSSIDRIAKQVDFLERGQADLCGSAQWNLNQKTQKIKPSKDKYLDSDLRALLTIYCTLCNSTITARAEIFKKFKYDGGIPIAEDYYLWTRIAAEGFRFHNLKDRLLTYRQYPEQSSSKHVEKFISSTLEIRGRYLELLGIPVHLEPRRMPYPCRVKIAINFMGELKLRFPKISFLALTEVYSRFQTPARGYRKIFIKLERYLIPLFVFYR